MTVKRTQKAGGSCGAANNKMKMNVGGSKKSSKKSPPNVCYCVKCRGKVTMLNPKDITKKTSKRTMKMRSGECPKCHGKVFKIVGA